MLKIDNKTNRIYLTKGDNAQIDVRVYEDNGKIRPIYDDDVITLTVRKNPNADVSLSKTAEKSIINILPEDTKLLSSGSYVYDIELKTFAGHIYTIIPMSYFDLGEEITK